MTKILTKQLIIQKAKTDIIENIKSINLWGNDLEEISFIKELINLELAQLASNKINTLIDIVKCSHLKDLNLRNNMISNLEELPLLKLLPNLKSLTLFDNPISKNPKYRYKILKYAVQLEKLDDIIISQEERQKVLQEEEKEKEKDNQNKLKICEKKQKIQKIDSKISKKKSLDKKSKQKESEDFKLDINKNQKNLKLSQGTKQILQNQQQEIQQSKLCDQQNIQFTNENKNVGMLLEKNETSSLKFNNKIQEEAILLTMLPQTSQQIQGCNNNQTASSETSQHILCAIISLLKSLSEEEYEFLKKEVESKLFKDIS
ncbi:unnamed protein product [Paramecium sonneborni]|uniref:Uncharacterized protein n=1 Tax=Paramecium sonneborni TaxID=65129 RepID=A0A8S1K168_9CILI|nr:unnamed protein product [Paramecium sonneborni]